MITIIFAPPRTGKTCFLTHIANMAAFDKVRNTAMRREILLKMQSGFNGIQTVPVHCVSANYDIVMHKFGYYPRLSRRINPYRLGYANEFVDTHFNLPYECICITEAQKYLNSRMSMYFPDWQSRWYEQHGHLDLDIFLDTQRPMLIDVNVHELAQFIEIMGMQMKYDGFGKVKSLAWTIRRIDNSSLFDRYMQSGKKDKECYTEEVVKADYNVFACYDSQNCKPKFYDGHLYDDYDYEQGELNDGTIDGYIRYLQTMDDELPENFYMRRKTA